MTVEIANIVGSGDLGVELDVEALEADLSTPYSVRSIKLPRPLRSSRRRWTTHHGIEDAGISGSRCTRKRPGDIAQERTKRTVSLPSHPPRRTNETYCVSTFSPSPKNTRNALCLPLGVTGLCYRSLLSSKTITDTGQCGRTQFCGLICDRPCRCDACSWSIRGCTHGLHALTRNGETRLCEHGVRVVRRVSGLSGE